jgi:ribosomal protein S27E
MQTVTRNTRAPLKGRLIVCPHCGGIARVFHFSWCGLGCIHCGQMVDKHKWGLAPSP